MTQTIHHVAVFHRKAWADSFAASIAAGGWRASNIERRKGNVVEFDAECADGDGWTHWADYAEHVGYHSSPNNPGRLDGRRAIPCY